MLVKSSTEPLLAPAAEQFPAWPVSWYFFAASSELRDGPVSKEVFGRRLVAFRTDSGRLCIMDGRCSHMGTDLGRGRVIGESIQCPYHHWSFGADGQCTHIPVTEDIPSFARQKCFAAAERHGYVFVFNGREPLFPLPFYEREVEEDFVCSTPAQMDLECPWYLIGANGFDLQHFRAAHERRLISEPTAVCPSAFARRATARFSVSGNWLQDRLTRWVAGDEVELTITDYCGTLMLATATFRRTRSHGMVFTEPLPGGCARIRVIVFVRRSQNVFGRWLFDWINLAIRKECICRFLAADAERLAGTRYNQHRFIEADRYLVEYFRWLAIASHGITDPLAKTTIT